MLHHMPFTALLTRDLVNDGRILPGGFGCASFEVATDPIQNGGWLPRVAGAGLAGLYHSGQSYDGGPST